MKAAQVLSGLQVMRVTFGLIELGSWLVFRTGALADAIGGAVTAAARRHGAVAAPTPAAARR